MATNTTNFGLKKPAYSDTADIADINGNMDKVDVSLNGLADAIAIVANNNTHAAITAGQFVYVHGHGSLAEGLYTAKSNIAANATLSTSNLQADGSGGLNALNSKITNLQTKQTNLYSTTTEITNGASITLSDSAENYAYLVFRLSTASNDPSSGRSILIIPTIAMNITAWYPIVQSNNNGAFRANISGTSCVINEISGFSSLYIIRIYGCIKVGS